MYDVIIIGAGPAGLAAAIYGKRAGMDLLVLDASPISGGQILSTYEVDNYPGLPGISGMELGQTFRKHADKLEVAFATGRVREIKDLGDCKQVITKKVTYEARAVVIATGANHRPLMVPGEEELCGMGVSYCATCDGAFFKNRPVAVVGGGDVALEDALFLARGCSQVTLIHRRDQFRGAKILQEAVLAEPKIQILYDTVVTSINGSEQVESLSLSNKKTGETAELPVAAVFLAVGIQPNVSFEGLPDQDEGGYLIAGEDGRTSISGIYAAGDVRTKQLRQVITATADGANVITSIQRDLLAE